MNKEKVFLCSDDGIYSQSMQILKDYGKKWFGEYEYFYISPRREMSSVSGLTIEKPIYKYNQFSENELVTDGTPRDEILIAFQEFGIPSLIVVLNSEFNLNHEIKGSGSYQFVKDYKDKNFTGIILNCNYGDSFNKIVYNIKTHLNLLEIYRKRKHSLWNINLIGNSWIRKPVEKAIYLDKIDKNKIGENIYYKHTYKNRLKLDLKTEELQELRNGNTTVSLIGNKLSEFMFFNNIKYRLHRGYFISTRTPTTSMSHDVWNFYNSNNKIKRCRGVGQYEYAIHHIDGDPTNNKIENLIKLTKSEHSIIENRGKIFSEETKRKCSESAILRHILPKNKLIKYKDQINIGHRDSIYITKNGKVRFKTLFENRILFCIQSSKNSKKVKI